MTYIDELGLKVELRCRSVGAPHNPDVRSRAASALGGEHCFLRVTCPFNKINSFISYLGPVVITSPGGKPNNDTQYSRELRYRTIPVTPPPDNSGDCLGCKFEKCVDTFARVLQATGYTMPNYSAVLGPNSNTFARRLVEECGASVGGPGPLTGWNNPPSELGF